MTTTVFTHYSAQNYTPPSRHRITSQLHANPFYQRTVWQKMLCLPLIIKIFFCKKQTMKTWPACIHSVCITVLFNTLSNLHWITVLVLSLYCCPLLKIHTMCGTEWDFRVLRCAQHLESVFKHLRYVPQKQETFWAKS